MVLIHLTHIMNCIVIFADWFFVHTKQVSTKVRTKSSIIFQLLHSSPNISCRWTFKVWISNIIQVADSNLCLTDVWWQLPSPPQPPSPVCRSWHLNLVADSGTHLNLVWARFEHLGLDTDPAQHMGVTLTPQLLLNLTFLHFSTSMLFVLFL